MNLQQTDHRQTWLDTLRSATSESHERLEELPISKAILSTEITLSDYADYLKLMWHVVKSVENQIFPLLAHVISDLDARRKTYLLENDLAFIKSAVGGNPYVFGNAADFDLPYALGIMYVVEGSALGGRYILKNIESALELNEEKGASYFAGYRNKTGSMWKNFLSMLSDYQNENGCGDEIIAGADFAFKAIYSHFSKYSD